MQDAATPPINNDDQPLSFAKATLGFFTSTTLLSLTMLLLGNL